MGPEVISMQDVDVIHADTAMAPEVISMQDGIGGGSN